MNILNLDLEYFMILDPQALPDNPKATEVEMMDAKNMFFYPCNEDMNK